MKIKSDFFEFYKTLSESEITEMIQNMEVFNPEGHPISNYNKAFLKFQNKELNFTVIAGYQQWQKFGRNVRKGVHGTWIFIPAMKKTVDEKTGKKTGEEEFDRFLMARVFDITQTFDLKDQAKKGQVKPELT